MKAALGTIPDKYIYTACVGAQALKYIYRGTDKIWPDNANRITAITLDITALENTINGAYWALALQAIASGTTPSRCIKLTSGGRTYCLNTTYSTYPVAYYEGNGRITYPHQTGPLSNTLKPGDNIILQLVIPTFDSLRVTGTQEDGAGGIYTPGNKTLQHTYTPAIPGTIVRRYFNKGQKKVSTGVRTQIQSQPSGTILHDSYRQQNGHGRAGYDENAYPGEAITYHPGDTTAHITVWPHQARGNWGGYLRYPAFNHNFTLKILSIETAQ